MLDPFDILENLTTSRPAMKTAHQRIQEISRVMKRAVEKAAEKHRLMGVPMVVWKDGKVVEFMPEPALKKSSPSRKIQN